MQQMLHVALTLVVLHHLVQAVAKRRAQGVECPVTLRATPALHARGFDPYHASHEMLPLARTLCSASAISARQKNQLILLWPSSHRYRRPKRLRATRVVRRFLNVRFPWATV